MYSLPRRFTWGPQKSADNLEARGFDYAFAACVFEGRTLEREDTRRDYGERRVVAIGVVDGVALTVVFTDRVTPEGYVERRIVSARVSNRQERRAYEDAIDTP